MLRELRLHQGSGTARAQLSTIRETNGVGFQLAMPLSPASWKLTPRRHRTVIPRTVLSYLRLLAAVTLIVCFDVSTFGAEPVPETDYQSEVLQDRPIAWWRFQDAAMPTMPRPATKRAGIRLYRGGVTSRPGRRDRGPRGRFDGKRAFLEVPHHADFAIGELSVEVWFRSSHPGTPNSGRAARR